MAGVDEEELWQEKVPCFSLQAVILAIRGPICRT